jgi:carbon monoxide dehydrogenase subunit G
MATIYREFRVEVPVRSVWDAIRDVGAVHSRLAKGFVVNTIVDGNTRTVVFANGYELREAIISIDDEHRRLAYSAVGGKASHHNAYFQVFEHGPQVSRVVWVTDLLPEEMKAPIEQMVNQGVEAIKKTFASR